ncbi:MAG: right-handed parallel beta-helix repeat-containing protein [Polyangiaceae bacterium]
MDRPLISTLFALVLLGCGSDDGGAAGKASGGASGASGAGGNGGGGSGGTDAGEAGASGSSGNGSGSAGGAGGNGGASGSAGSAGTPGVSSIGPQSVVPTSLSQGTIFAAPKGSGNACSEASPCDIWTAMNQASGGDVVFLRGGTYAIGKNLYFSTQASQSSPLVVESYPGESAVLDGSQHAKGTQIYVRVTGKFVHLRRLEVKNMPMQGIWIGGTDNVLDGVHAHHNGLSGIQIFSPYEDFPYGAKGSRNTLRNCTTNDNSGAGIFDAEFANGGNSDGISISSGADNRVENCLVYGNSDDGIDTWRSTNTYVGYSISYANGIADGNGQGIKAGGQPPSADTVVERCLSYSNKASGIDFNSAKNATFLNNTTWDNQLGFSLGKDTGVTGNIAAESKNAGNGIPKDNSWQRSGSVTFISTNPKSNDFLKPTVGGGFEDIGAHAP